jgi:hypothetical protein
MSSNRPTDPIDERIRKAKETQKAEADVEAGEHALANEFQRQADKTGREELAKIEAMLAARCQTINANRAEDVPECQYDERRHELRAGKFALILSLTEGYSPYFFDMTSGLRSDAAQVFDPDFEPEYEATNWRFFAGMDDNGFFWECDGRRLSNEEVVEEGLKALANNLVRG